MARNETINIGKALIKYSDDFSLQELSQNELLAPYLIRASENMSLRQISSFISDTFSYSISASTISRIINNKDEHYKNLAAYLKNASEWIARIYETKASSLLVSHAELEHQEWSSPLSNLYNEIQELLTYEPDSTILIKQSDVVLKLIDVWENLPNEIQHELLDIMDLEPDLR